MRKTIIPMLLVAVALAASAQETPRQSWVKLARQYDDTFFGTHEAARIADNVLRQQRASGGWPKNVYMPEADQPPTADTYDSTIDNDATTTEIRFLARLHGATGEARYAEAALRGIAYLLAMQYGNGGFPQFWPQPKGYHAHITYNDNAMVNVLQLLRQVAERQRPYAFVPDSVAQRAAEAFGRGIQCILDTQVRQEGQRTVWCAQHDGQTLLPAAARAYELASLSGQESVGITLLLMSLPHPTDSVIAAVEGAVQWFRRTRITGLTKEYFTDSEGRRDYRMAPCPQDDYPCPPLWARFYTLEDNRPFFCDRDGVPRYNLSEIGHERRNGYSWYGSQPQKVLSRYAEWRESITR